jgi:hypothetical protein
VPAPPTPRSRTDAQHRADRIRAFQSELAAAIRDGALDLTPDQLARVSAYHDELLADLARTYDVDISAGQKRVSAGMRVVTLIGAVALALSVMLLFFRIWGWLSTPLQVVVLTSAPLLALAALELVSRRESLRFATALVAMVAFACFAVDIEMLGRLFNPIPSPEALLAYGIFALALAYGYDQRLLLVAGASCVAGWIASSLVRSTGDWWMGAAERPEGFVVAAVPLFAWSLLPHPRRDDFPPYLRALGLFLAALALLLLGRAGQLSWIDADRHTVEAIYQALGFVVAAAAIVVGLARGWPETTAIGGLAFIASLLVKFVDWWWERLPRFLFFLLVGIAAFVLLAVFRQVRARLQEH